MSNTDQVVLTREEYRALVNRVNALEFRSTAVEDRCSALEESVGACQIHLEQIEEAEHAAEDTQPDIRVPYDPATDRYLIAATEWGCSRKEAKNRILQAEHVLNNLEKHARRLPQDSRGWHPDDDGRG